MASNLNLLLRINVYGFFFLFSLRNLLKFLQNLCVAINVANTFQTVKCSELANSCPKVSRRKSFLLSSEHGFPSFSSCASS